MTHSDLLIVSIGGVLAGIALLLTAKYTVWKRAKQLAARESHPAE